ncbi:hypothetical protein HPHPH28_1544 [Helicobacter pylori Hp H-28]|nr:hypothetical protein HPHPH28_1544 [Helicobacter pylori Hp H-28]
MRENKIKTLETSQVAPSHTDITRDARGNNLLLDDDYR